MVLALLQVLLLLSVCLFWTLAVDRTKFRTCQQTSFCRRHRSAERGRQYLVSGLKMDSPGVAIADLKGGPNDVPLSLSVQFYTNGVSRIRVIEKKPLHGPRWEVDGVLC